MLFLKVSHLLPTPVLESDFKIQRSEMIKFSPQPVTKLQLGNVPYPAFLAFHIPYI